MRQAGGMGYHEQRGAVWWEQSGAEQEAARSVTHEAVAVK